MATLNVLNIRIKNLPSYDFHVDFFGNKLFFKLTWVERSKKRFVTVTSDDGVVLLQNTAIVVNELIPFNNVAKNYGLPCSLLLHFKDGGSRIEDYYNWADNMLLALAMETE